MSSGTNGRTPAGSKFCPSFSYVRRNSAHEPASADAPLNLFPRISPFSSRHVRRSALTKKTLLGSTRPTTVKRRSRSRTQRRSSSRWCAPRSFRACSRRSGRTGRTRCRSASSRRPTSCSRIPGASARRATSGTPRRCGATRRPGSRSCTVCSIVPWPCSRCHTSLAAAATTQPLRRRGGITSKSETVRPCPCPFRWARVANHLYSFIFPLFFLSFTNSHKSRSDVFPWSRRNDLLSCPAHRSIGECASESQSDGDLGRGGRGEPRPEGLGDRKARHSASERVGEVRDRVPVLGTRVLA